MSKYDIYHRKDGRWEGRILIKKDNFGKRKYKYIFGKTKELVAKSIDNYKKIVYQLIYAVRLTEKFIMSGLKAYDII